MVTELCDHGRRLATGVHTSRLPWLCDHGRRLGQSRYRRHRLATTEDDSATPSTPAGVLGVAESSSVVAEPVTAVAGVLGVAESSSVVAEPVTAVAGVLGVAESSSVVAEPVTAVAGVLGVAESSSVVAEPVTTVEWPVVFRCRS